jgi:hypothetical protein
MGFQLAFSCKTSDLQERITDGKREMAVFVKCTWLQAFAR